MAFNLEKFDATSFAVRTKSLPVPSLQHWFDEDEEAVWEIRNLTASELATANAAQQKNANVAIILEALSGSDKTEKVEELRTALGISTDVPGEIAKRLEMIVLGSINPKIPLNLAVKLAEHFPIEFYTITNEITQLTGMGSEIEGK